MLRNASYDVVSLIISVFMLLNFGIHKKTPLPQSKIFAIFISVNMLTALMNTLYAIVLRLNMQLTVLPEIFVTGYFITHLFCAPLMMFYIISFNMTWHEFSRRMKLMLSIPLAIGELIILTNPFTKFIYYFDELGTYTRNSGITAIYLIAAYYFVYIAFWLIRYKGRFHITERKYLIFLLGFALASMLIQFIFPNELVESCAISISMLVLFLTIQNPHELYDNASGAFNHRTFISVVGTNFASEKSFTVIQIVLDDLSAIGSTFGVQQTAIAAAEIVTYLNSINDNQAMVYRTDSNVFCIELQNVTPRHEDEIVDAIHQRFSRSWKIEDGHTMMTARTCLIECPKDVKSADELAEIMGCFLRSNTGVRINYASDINIAAFKRERYIEALLERVIKENSLEVIYIPVYSFKKNKIVFAEATVRIYDKELGYIYADEFMHLAERTKMIVKIGEYMFDRVCRFISDGRLLERGIEVVTIRISAVQCMQSELVADFGAIKRKYNIPNSSICFEVAENVVATTKDSFAGSILNLSSDGVRFCLSEYGTGFTNISFVYDLPFDYIKIDKNVVSDSISNLKANLTLESTMQLIKELGMDTMVDGVNDEAMFNTISDMPCDFAQGRFFARALSELEFIDFITNFEAPKLTANVGGDTSAL